jgi:primosomal protein N' (replication factor Y)
MMSCQNCDAKLTTYQRKNGKKELLCHQCQTSYTYPNKCPSCNKVGMQSIFGGVDKLEQILTKELELKVSRADKAKPEHQIALSTRVFDPNINYQLFDQIIFIKAENLLSYPDYSVTEEVCNDLAKVVLKTKPGAEIIFDAKATPQDLFSQQLLTCKNPTDIKTWLHDKLQAEAKLRKQFEFPPYTNILLITSQENNYQKSVDKIQEAKKFLTSLCKDDKNLQISQAYPAKFLKRRNKFSHHITLRYPRKYQNFNWLSKQILHLQNELRVQTRLNPRHLF